MSNLIYVQSTGEFFHGDSPELRPILHGYSGAGEHKNWPSSQCLNNFGPIPRGRYKIGDPETIGELTSAVKLTPALENDMCGRSGFLIHGDNQTAPGWVSGGSIIIDGEDHRKELATFEYLIVIAARPIALGHLQQIRSASFDPESSPSAFSRNFLGWGFRSYANELSTAPVFDASAYSLPATQTYNIVNFGVIATKEHFEEALSVDAQVSGGGSGISATAKANLSERYSRDLTSVTIALTKKVMAGRYTLDTSKFPLDKLAEETAEENPADYVKSYGDEVVSAVGMGGACCYLFKFGFKSQQEASSFAGSIGASYGSFSGSVSEARSKLLQRTDIDISLAGYSTGTLDVPQVIKNSPVRDKANFLFDPQTGDTMIRNLLDFFDGFQSHFSERYAENPSKFPQYSQVEIQYRSLHQIAGFPNKEAITKLGDAAVKIAEELDGQYDLALRRLNELEYMTNRCVKYNTEDAMKSARSFIEALDALCRQTGKIQKRRRDLAQALDLESEHRFYNDIPELPGSFCTIEPERRVSSYRLKGDPDHVTLYTFDISKTDYGRTCRIEAQAVLRQYDADDTTHAKIELVRKRKGGDVPFLRKVTVAKNDESWQPVEVKEQSCGHNDGYYLTLKPVIFVPSEDEMYAIRAFSGPGQIYQQDVTLTTYLSKRL